MKSMLTFLVALALLPGAAALRVPNGPCMITHLRRSFQSPLTIRAAADGNTDAVAKPTEPLSPQNALEELVPLLEQVKLVWTEGSTWSVEERVERRRDIVERYVRVFAPALAFSAAQLSLSLGVFAVVLVALSVSGRGYGDVASLLSDLPILGGLLENVDPGLGNAAIALIVVEAAAPLLLPIALALSPGMSASLQAKLEGWGLDADGLNARIEKVLIDTTD